jgi:hypothetical protein
VDKMVVSIDGLIQNLINTFWALFDVLKSFAFGLFDYFSFDSPKKTLMLAVLMLFGVFLIINLFSSQGILSSGVEGVNGNSVLYLNSQGDGVSNTGNNTGGGGNKTNPEVSNKCQQDSDCQNSEGNEEGICCTPSEYTGYFCAGYCLSARAGQNRDACKLPGACKRLNTDTEVYVKNLQSSCMNENIQTARRDVFCQEKTGSTPGINGNGLCCQTIGEPCFGMCLKDGAKSCLDTNGCFNEKEKTVKAISATEVN